MLAGRYVFGVCRRADDGTKSTDVALFPHPTMTIADSRSAADDAYQQFLRAVAEKRIFQLSTSLSEADTRSKLIDPLFKKVLGWHEAEIRRELAVTKGYVDYVLGSDFNHLLIEAKRATPRFQLSVVGKPRRVQLDGPHLLANKRVRPHVEQAQGYAADLGVAVCVLTNGTQLVAFRPSLPGRSWKKGTAIVYHDHTDIDQHFAEFYNLFSRDAVIEGALIEAFEATEKASVQHHAPIEFISDPDKELVRNKVWQLIAKTMGPLLTDGSGDVRAQLEVIENCYVTTPLGDQTDSSLDQLLRDTPQGYLEDSKFVDLRSGAGGKTAFSHHLEADVKGGKNAAYVLTGGVGSGKTTFLRRYAHLADRAFVERFTAWFHVDFLAIGNVDPLDLERELRAHVYRTLREQLGSGYAAGLFDTGEALRSVFAVEIDEARKTVLYGLSEGEQSWNDRVNQLVDALYRDDERFVVAALRRLRERGRRIAVILDNTDQLGEAFQASVFLLAQKLAADFRAVTVVTLREEKFFAAYRRGIFDAYGDKRFHIGSPDLRHILKKRLEYGRIKFAALQRENGGGWLALGEEDLRRIDGLLRALIASTTGRNANIVRMLASVSNGNMRHALDMFREFLSSGNTNVDKIIRIVEERGGYIVPFHEFAKSAILGTRKYYRSDLSPIVNVFRKADAAGASHLTGLRLLSRMSAAAGAASEHGQGYVALVTLLREYREVFGSADDFVQWGSELVRRGLLEAEPPRTGDIRRAEALRISAAGEYYWRYLVRSFAYLDLVFVDTPLAEKKVAQRLAMMAELADLVGRFERVRLFLDCMRNAEARELAQIASRAGPYHEALVPVILAQVETEISVISERTGVVDEFRE